MKKVLALLMVALFALSLCACGAPTVEEAINGSAWEINLPYEGYVILFRLEFNEGRIHSDITLDGKDVGIDSMDGTYVVNEDGTIDIRWSGDEDVVVYHYQYENEILRLFIGEDSGTELERVR